MSAGISKSIKSGVLPSQPSHVADVSQQESPNIGAEPSSQSVAPVAVVAGYTNEPMPKAPTAPDPLASLARAARINFGPGFFAELDLPVEIPEADQQAMASPIFADRYFNPAEPLPDFHIEQHLSNLRLS